jgi:hypothetical protein
MGALPAQCQYAVMHSYAYKTLPTSQDENCFVARNVVGCRMYMQIQGTGLSVYLLECKLLTEVYQCHANHCSKHNPSFMDQNTPLRMQLKPFGGYKHS